MSKAHVQKKLEATFGTVPVKIEENLKYFIYDHNKEEFFCCVCEEGVKKESAEKTTKSFEEHFCSPYHAQNCCPVEDVKAALTETFSGKIPQIIFNNIFSFDMDDYNYYCILCNKTIPDNTTPSITEQNFSYHLLSQGHYVNLEECRKTEWCLQEMYGYIPAIIFDNIQFLEEENDNYTCKICKVHILVDPLDISKTEEIFEKHLLSAKHLKNTKETRAFERIPVFKKVFTSLPNYMLRNIEYFSLNGNNCFCSICNENIKVNPDKHFETEQNLKLHIFSCDHEQSLMCRRDPNNEVYLRLKQLFETFPDSVSDDLKHLSVIDNIICCSICEEFIFEDDSGTETIQNITIHFESTSHKNKVFDEYNRRTNLVKDLEGFFGCIPQQIQENIPYMKVSGNTFECFLCETKLSTGVSKRISPEHELLDKHFESAKHIKELEVLEILSHALGKDLEHLFYSIPPFILNNWDFLGYQNSNFHCFLCDTTIRLDKGCKKEELTLQNFRAHLLSSNHLNEVKIKANEELESKEKLVSHFGKVPEWILSNVEHLYKNKNDFYCGPCDFEIITGNKEVTASNFYQHLSSHSHRKKIFDLDGNTDDAFMKLDSILQCWRIPNFILRNIDFIIIAEHLLFCQPCQEVLFVDNKDMYCSFMVFRVHFASKPHQQNMKMFHQ